MSKRALLVGINYIGTSCALGGCINDVLNIKQILISKYGYPEGNILLLTDNTVHKPTAANILEAFVWLLSESPASYYKTRKYIAIRSNLKLYFHYSGHGSQVPDRNKDESDGKDETLCPLDYASAGMLTDDVIRLYLASKVPSNCQLISIIDACHSESSFDLMWTCVPTYNGFFLNKVEQYIATAGTVIMLSGCKDAQTSADINVAGKGQGALTYSVLEVLKKSNYSISLDNLLKEVRSFIITNKLSDQVPCLSLGKFVDITLKINF